MGDYRNPEPGTTYFSKRLDAFGQQDRKARIASKVIEGETYAFATVKDEIVIRHKDRAKTNITAKFFEDDRGIPVLNIQGYTTATDKPHNASFSFLGDEIGTLLEFVANIRSVEFRDARGLTIADDALRKMVLSKRQAQTLVTDNEELFTQVVASAITKSDVVAIAYRKKQLEVVRRLIEEPDYFLKAKETKNNCSDEKLRQMFFQKNPWIFGYGLNYVYLDALDGKQLEQYVHGNHVGAHGKEVDALMKSKGAISSLCFVEIKTSKTALLAKKDTRAGCWPISPECAGAVSQVQGTVALAMDALRGSFRPDDKKGFPIGEEVFNYAPKSFLVIGNLAQFKGEHGVNRDMLRSFELMRRNLHSPEIMTFDELFARAQFIVQQAAPQSTTSGHNP